MAIRLTERAAEEFKAVCNDRSLPIETTKLRVDAERDEEEAEGKLLISLKLDDKMPQPDDEVESTIGAQVVINKSLGEALGEVRIDYKEDGGGFVLERVQ